MAASTAEAASCSHFCFYHHSNQQGSSILLKSNVSDLAGYTFNTSGAGQGQHVKNNAASAFNMSQCQATVYDNSNYSGPQDTFMHRQSGQLRNTYNNNASLYFATNCG